jgi:GC-rich sequence DNA-binding factor
VSPYFKCLLRTLMSCEVNDDTVIPSESSILSAKQRRERMRIQGTQDDFISLSVTKRDIVPQGPHPESRLMREEDEIGEGDDGM